MHLGAGVEGDDPQPLQEYTCSTDRSGWLRGADLLPEGFRSLSLRLVST